MGRKPLAVILISLIVLSAFLGGCRKSAAPPIGELTPEEEATAAVQEAQQNTGEGDQTESPVATATTEASPATEEVPTTEPTAESTVEPAPTTAPDEQAPVTEPTAVPTPVPTPVTTSGSATTYVVQPGDNLFRIALKHNLAPAALAQANNITNPALIYVGQTLTIPAGSSSSPTTPSTPTGCETVYVVQPGDNLFRIALRYNYSQYYLAEVNNIGNPSVVYVGQQICIP